MIILMEKRYIYKIQLNLKTTFIDLFNGTT
ncbi:Uncharacterised protein [uncultured archaeon]|nr:Uncharacterised protein [uncultured archaeon]